VTVSIALGVLWVCLATPGFAWSSADDGAAIVAELRGSATIQDPDGRKRQLERYEWLAQGANITVAKRSRVILVLATGARFELAEDARVTVDPAGLPISRTVRALPAFPPVPTLPPLDAPSDAGTRKTTSAAVSGAMRIRGSSVGRMYPSDVATIAEKTTLRFRAPNGATAFFVVVEDEEGRRVFDIRSARAEIVVPPGTLGAGRRYSWRVTVEDDILPAEGEAAFTTLSASTVLGRDAFVAGLRRDNPGELALLALIDERLGLLIEARDELVDADKRAPGDPQVRQMLGRIRERIGDPSGGSRP
jgi:hypothetical protein